ncbi:MAG TPA: M15 family metallopeptidase [Bacteroidia bacterium]|nr:M15 family metallopeptidase [Bacteroidia bacterium]
MRIEKNGAEDKVFRKDTSKPDAAEMYEMADSFLAAGLTDVRQQDSSIQVDLKYAGSDNFLGFNMYGKLKRCFLQPDVTGKLVKAQKILRSMYPFYGLIVYDAVRPLHIQKMMWDTLKMPAGIKQQYLSSPQVISLHNYGAAVDLSIITRDGLLLDMGTPYDFFGPLAHPEFEDRFREEGKLSLKQILNRELLRTVMHAAGFSPIETEWWHFNSCSRQEAARMYKVIQ